MEEISKELFEKLKVACESCECNIISLSGGLDSTIIAYFLKDRNLQPISIITKNFVADDLMYCQLAAKEFKLPLSIVEIETFEILEAIKGTISILKNFNDIEIRNNIVMYLAIKWAKENGSNGIITGDGADELFAGYSFLLQKSENDLEKEINRICSIMHFPTQKIGKALGVKIESPFLNEDIIELAKSIPVNLKVKMEGDKKYGKWILRKTFENKIPFQIAWREKSPMQDGAGTSHLSEFFNSLISDEDFAHKKKNIERDAGIKIRTKESMHYFEIFKNIFGLSESNQNEGNSCPYCHYNTENSKFCRMCGAFPI